MSKGIPGKKLYGPSVIIFIALLLLPFFIPKFYTYILSVIFVTSLLAMSMNMAISHGGLFVLHHGAFYGVGAYAFALILTKTDLPSWVGFVAGPVLSATVGLLVGWFCIRLTKLYFGMLHISLGSLIWAVAFRWYGLTGGDDGTHGIPLPNFLSTLYDSYYFILIVLVSSLITLYLIFKSPFGLTLQAIRDNPERCEAVGINVRHHQLMTLVITTFFAGVAGVLFVVMEGSVFPDLLFWVLSLEVFIMCLLGGWFTFAGPILGAAIIVSLRTFVGAKTEYWTLILGVVLILLIFFLPEGIMGYILGKLGPQREQAQQRGGE